jgi:hypothetical protein
MQSSRLYNVRLRELSCDSLIVTVVCISLSMHQMLLRLIHRDLKLMHTEIQIPSVIDNQKARRDDANQVLSMIFQVTMAKATIAPTSSAGTRYSRIMGRLLSAIQTRDGASCYEYARQAPVRLNRTTRDWHTRVSP